jgi:exosortase/archaeosortase family protein
VGWIGFFAVSALILAYPRKTLRSKLFGVAIALPLMYVMNILRLGTTLASWYYGGARVLDFTHDLLWRTVLIFWALALWLFWVKYISVPVKKVKYTGNIGNKPWKRSRRTRKRSRPR